MAKSFCNGCIHWVWYRQEYSAVGYFKYCDLLETWEIKKRKEKCNGKYWEE